MAITPLYINYLIFCNSLCWRYFFVYGINGRDYNSEEPVITYIILIVLEVISILGINLWTNIKCRVNLGLDGPLPEMKNKFIG